MRIFYENELIFVLTRISCENELMQLVYDIHIPINVFSLFQ